ncbi:transcription factor S-II, central domain-containing protein [Limtongia smithiae]|uniref:transcription factor S-II, central domain-containing protein n=1 Tax=Limtongia smithiae TaxID=1125753 RepID=UPI0034CF46E0
MNKPVMSIGDETAARRQSAAAISSALEAASGSSAATTAEAATALGVAIEAAVYEQYNNTLNRPILREKLLNMKHNPALARALLAGTLSPGRFASMTSAEMATDERRRRDQEISEENMRASAIDIEDALNGGDVKSGLLDARAAVRRISFGGDPTALDGYLQQRQGGDEEDEQNATELEFENH